MPDKDTIEAGANVLIEVARAEQEQQLTAQKAIELVRDAGSFLDSVFRAAAEEFGLLLGDQMRYWRFKNFVRILKRVEEIIHQRGLTPEQLRRIPFGQAILTIEAASLEEEESVQELWSRLIANALDPRENVVVRKLYVDILKALSPSEAAFLELLWRCEERTLFRTKEEVETFNNEVNELAASKWRRFEEVERKAAIQNLARLRCVTFRPRPIDMSRLFAVLSRDQYRSTFDRWAAVDPERFEKVVQDIGDWILVAAGVKDYQQASPISLSSPLTSLPVHNLGKLNVPEMNFMLTPMGSALMKACNTDRPNGAFIPVLRMTDSQCCHCRACPGNP